MVTALLDGNVLIALSVTDHIHHAAAQAWLAGNDQVVATCPMTQGTLIRLLLLEGRGVRAALNTLSLITEHPRHAFWPDDLSFHSVRMDGIAGHRQVTDAYLAHLARMNGGRLATFDRALAGLHSDVADLIATG